MTFSLGIEGFPADAHIGTVAQADIVIDDSVCNTPAAEQRAMSSSTPFLGQGPDGQLGWYVYDAERSIPGVLRVLMPLRP